MYILAFDTTTKLGSLAITYKDQLISSYTLRSDLSHSKRLLPLIEYALQQSSLTLKEITGFGVTIGPGSFTGIRIGMSVAKGLSYATGKPLVGITTLEAMAAGLPFGAYLICPVIDAKKGEVYAGFFRHQGEGLRRVLPEIVSTPEGVCQYIDEPTIFLGDGTFLYREIFRKRLPGKAFFVSEGQSGSIAACVAHLTYDRIRTGKTMDPNLIRPYYIRRSEAELKQDQS